MTTPISNIDNTTLIALTANLDVGDIADPALRLAYFQYLNVYIQVITAAHNAFVANGAIASANIADLAISTAKIALLAVGTAQLADSSVTSAKIVDGAIATIDIANLAITAAKIALLAVGTAQLADSSVTSAKILDGTILNVDINPLAGIDPAKLADGSVNATKFQYINTLIGNVQTQLNNKPDQTVATLTYYVTKTGSDSNNGLTIGSPFLTIGKAIGLLPQHINHTVTINVSPGTYAETVQLAGLAGAGSIILVFGTDSVDALTYIITRLFVINCQCHVEVSSFATNDATYAVFADNSSSVRINASNFSATATNGIYSQESKVFVGFSVISNKTNAINAVRNSQIYSAFNSGSSNTIGLLASGNSSIGKGSTQPSGTTAESTSTGGVIR